MENSVRGADSGRDRALGRQPVRIDPSPRQYAPSVEVLRRASVDAGSVRSQRSVSEVETWLLTDAIGERDMFNLFWRFVKEVRAAGIPMDRANLHIGTLHPQLFGVSPLP